LVVFLFWLEGDRGPPDTKYFHYVYLCVLLMDLFYLGEGAHASLWAQRKAPQTNVRSTLTCDFLCQLRHSMLAMWWLII